MLFSLLLAAPAFAAEVCITVPSEKVERINHAKDLYNAREGSAYSSLEWAKRMLIEAVAREYMAERQAENDELRDAARQAWEQKAQDLMVDTQSVWQGELQGW